MSRFSQTDQQLNNLQNAKSDKPQRIGIVGGGQLGRMLTLAAKKLGFYIIVLDPTPQSPASQVADKQIIADFKDEKGIRALAEESDVITFESEFINDTVLKELLKEGKRVDPSPKTLSIIKDKLNQKQYLKNNSIPTADFMGVTTVSDIKQAIKKFGYPILLKARFDAYDGKGNFVINNESDITKGIEKLEGRELYVEHYVPFVKEVAIMVACSIKGEIVPYPVVETIHKDNVCDVVIIPARISSKAAKNAMDLAMQVASHLEGAGVFGVEMFLGNDDNVCVNELAPRVHNSGHYSIEACKTSQFEQHIRAITGLPLGETTLLVKAAVMKNILGESNGPGKPEGLEIAQKIPGVTIHMYGKHESRVGRKMGHITVTGNDVDECLKKAEEVRNLIHI